MTRLSSISITDFRSIRGSIIVPLDAPIVLIHGQNGTGKTSLLSAIELGLTRHIPSFQRIDQTYINHLIHKDAQESRISVEVNDLPYSKTHTDIRISRTGVEGTALLEPASARFYSERCYLAQATLGRLLEIYENKDARKSDSPLTKFVKDLLGLDQLDNLIDGLHDAGDVRRFRSTVPLYWETRENISSLDRELEQKRTDFASVVAAETQTTRVLEERLSLLSIEPSLFSDVDTLIARLSEGSDDTELQSLARLRRDVTAAHRQWQAVATGISAEERASTERAAAAAKTKLDFWQTGSGVSLEHAIAAVAFLLPDQIRTAPPSPELRRAAALRAVEADLTRLTALITQADDNDAKFAALSQDVERAQARSAVLDKQIAEHASDAEQLAKVLSDVLQHIHTDDCPVCGRDFAEISKIPFQAHVSARIGALTENAGHLQALARDRANTASALATAKRELDLVGSRRLDLKGRDDARTREARLSELRKELADLGKDVAEGEHLTSVVQATAREHADLQSRDLQATSVLETITRLAGTLGLDPLGETQSPNEALDRYHAHIVAIENKLERRQVDRRAALSETREVQELRAKRDSLKSDIETLEARIKLMNAKKDAADKIISDARELARRARDARTKIVRSVFNDSLNSIWRDLFVRLAPEEPFVPAFSLPTNSGGAVEAVLETHYRSAGKGGNPRSVLSAGNLNTAAFTLFVALHLSVAPTLPWLVIDDPVQSMDEVHIAQFAALLRTLSKMHNRQIIIAVHEKPLFDYLALELSPAFKSDRLITIELSRDADGSTIMDYQSVVWQPDSAIAA